MKTVRVLFGFGVLVSLASGCSVYDKSLLGKCAPNTVGCLPSAPVDRSEPDGGGNQTAVWALTNIDLNQENDAWVNQGLNLDGRVTTDPSQHQSCVPARGAGAQIDGTSGIDNVYGEVLYSTIVRGSVPRLSDQLCCWGRRGRGTILVRVDDWNGTATDPKVRLSVLYAVDGTTDADAMVQWDSSKEHGLVLKSDGTTPAALPSWDIDTTLSPPMTPTRWWVDPASFVGGDPTTPYVTDPNAWISNGFVVLKLPGDQPITLMIGNDTSLPAQNGKGGSLKITLQGAYAWAQLSDDLSHIVNGGLAGRLGKTQLLSVASSIGVCVPMETISGVIDVYGDIHANPADDTDPTSTCDAVSFGTSFRGVRGTIAGVASEGLCLVDSCKTSSYDTCVTACAGNATCVAGCGSAPTSCLTKLGSDNGTCGNATTTVPTCPSPN